MHQELIERCAEALWNDYIKDPANRHHLNRVFKKPYTLTWKEANDPDIIPMFADQFRAKARVVIIETRRYIIRSMVGVANKHVLSEIYEILNE